MQHKPNVRHTFTKLPPVGYNVSDRRELFMKPEKISQTKRQVSATRSAETTVSRTWYFPKKSIMRIKGVPPDIPGTV